VAGVLADASGLLPNMLSAGVGGEVWVVGAAGGGIEPNMLPVANCAVVVGAAKPLKGDVLAEGASFVVDVLLEKPLLAAAGKGLAELAAGWPKLKAGAEVEPPKLDKDFVAAGTSWSDDCGLAGAPNPLKVGVAFVVPDLTGV